MNIKEQFKTSWTFIITGIVFVLFAILSKTGIYEISPIYIGLGKILLAITLTYSSVQVSKNLYKGGKYLASRWFVYGTGFLSGLWLYDSIQFLW